MSPRPLVARYRHACPSCVSAWSARSALGYASGSTSYGYGYDASSANSGSAYGFGGRRYAHAAAMPQDDAAAGPSRRHADYTFPTRGKRGGPPDPFEVLGLERSALPGEIKAKCECPFLCYPYRLLHDLCFAQLELVLWILVLEL